MDGLVAGSRNGRCAGAGKVSGWAEGGICVYLESAESTSRIGSNVEALEIVLCEGRTKRKQNKHTYTGSFQESVQFTPHLSIFLDLGLFEGWLSLFIASFWGIPVV